MDEVEDSGALSTEEQPPFHKFAAAEYWGLCSLQSSGSEYYKGCDGKKHNKDLYLKKAVAESLTETFPFKISTTEFQMGLFTNECSKSLCNAELIPTDYAVSITSQDEPEFPNFSTLDDIPEYLRTLNLQSFSNSWNS